MIRISVALVMALLPTSMLAAETCTTQSAMAPAERTSLADAARTIAGAVQSNDAAGLRAISTADIQQNFGALQYMVAMTSPNLVGATPQVEEVYLLDAATLKPATDSNSEAQFFCSLNKTTQEVDFTIPGLTPGRYGFAMVSIQSRPIAWRISLLLRQESGKWLIAGIYPKPMTLAGHDGLWYWSEARTYAKNKQQWNAWLFYQAAQTLLRPTDFVLSTHLEKLRNETASAAPPALSDGISPETPLVVKAAGSPSAASGGKSGNATAPVPQPSNDFRFTGLALTAPSIAGTSSPVLSLHLRADALSDPAAARQRNTEAVNALLAAYPELRKPYEGFSITTESPNQPPLTTTIASGDLK